MLNMRKKTYRGHGLSKHETTVTVETEGGAPEPLAPRNDLRNHSPTGFSWGYNGSGPAQLALAILADAASDPVATSLYQVLKDEIVSHWHGEEFTLTGDRLQEWLESKGMDHPRLTFTSAVGELHRLAVSTKEENAQHEEDDDPGLAQAYSKLVSATFDLEDALRLASRPNGT